MRKAIASKNKELKKIAEEVDKDLSAAMLKGLKSDRSLPIKDIFSAKKSSNESISFLHNELTKIRKNIKKAKEEVQRMDCSFTNPIFQNYQDRGLEYRTKLKEYETEIR